MIKLKVIALYLPLLILDILIPLFTNRTFKQERKNTMAILKLRWNAK